MGDRGVVHIVHPSWGDSVYLYTHWRGSQLPDILKKSLKRGRERWQDSSYLARIIFCDMVEGQEKEITGFGISNRPQDGIEHTLDIDAQTVTYDGRTWGFDEFTW